jgi:hypothetical protein
MESPEAATAGGIPSPVDLYFPDDEKDELPAIPGFPKMGVLCLRQDLL